MNDSEIQKLDKYVQYDHFRDGSPSWENFISLHSGLNEYEREAKLLIKIALGYLPSVRIYADYMPFLKSAVHQWKIGKLKDKAYYKEFTSLVKQIRNKQMALENRTREFGNDDFEDYFRIGKEYKHQARTILFEMLGFEPKNIHSLDGELILRRDRMISETPAFEGYNASAYLAATITLYRYNYLEHGQEAADDTKLLGFEIQTPRALPQA